MPQILTSIDTGSILSIGDEALREEILTFTGIATVLAGTILARDSVSLKMVPYVKNGVTNGNGIPKGVLGYSATSTGAGDVPGACCDVRQGQQKPSDYQRRWQWD